MVQRPHPNDARNKMEIAELQQGYRTCLDLLMVTPRAGLEGNEMLTTVLLAQPLLKPQSNWVWALFAGDNHGPNESRIATDC